MIKRVVVAGGGTGGHLFPGISVVEELRRRDPDLDVLFVGTSRGIEARIIPQMGESFECLVVEPLKGRSAREIARSIALLPGACMHALGVLKRYKPDLVLGVGGYASGPMLLAASALGIPSALLEQNASVGLTNRLLAQTVGRAYVTFSETAPVFGTRRTRVFGNAVRRSFVETARLAVSDPEGFEARSRRVVVLGGSQGARALNEVVPRELARAGLSGRHIPIVHQTGERMVDAVRSSYAALGIQAEVVPFIDDMAKLYASAMLVIARAGATTVAELTAIGRASILVPFPHAADDHQRKNAEALARRGAALVLSEDDLEQGLLAPEVSSLVRDPKTRLRMSEAARNMGRPEAAASIVDDLYSWLDCDLESSGSPLKSGKEARPLEDDSTEMHFVPHDWLSAGYAE